MQGSTEGNPGTTEDLAQVSTPLTRLARPNRARDLASGGGDSMRRRENQPECQSGSCKPKANDCQFTNSLNTTLATRFAQVELHRKINVCTQLHYIFASCTE